MISWRSSSLLLTEATKASSGSTWGFWGFFSLGFKDILQKIRSSNRAMNWSHLYVNRVEGLTQIPIMPSKNAPFGIWILAFLRRVRSDHARNLHWFIRFGTEKPYNEKRLLTKTSPRARKPEIDQHNQISDLPSWMRLANIEAKVNYEPNIEAAMEPVPFASMLLFNARIAASSSSSAASNELKKRERQRRLVNLSICFW